MNGPAKHLGDAAPKMPRHKVVHRFLAAVCAAKYRFGGGAKFLGREKQVRR